MSIDIEKIFENNRIDYINLDDINVFFKFKILKYGKLLYTTDENKLYEYIHKIQKQYIEMSYSRKKYTDYVLNNDSLKREEQYMDKDRIDEKMLYLKELLFELNEISKMDKKEFLKNKMCIEATENYLKKSLQVVIDLADDIVSKNRLRNL